MSEDTQTVVKFGYGNLDSLKELVDETMECFDNYWKERLRLYRLEKEKK